MEPITRGADFRLAGTEVFHAECVHLIAESTGTKRHLRLIEANRQLVAARETNRQLEAELDETRIDCNRKNQRIAALERAKADTDTARETIQTLRDDVERGRQQLAQASRERDRAKLELAQAQTDLTAARKELETQRAAGAPPAAAEAVSDNDYGGAEARFRLLELD